jgi:nicotinate-nucleotide adenylyltransferase
VTENNLHIGLLGGSFNPLHNGHLAIVESFLLSPLIDELWLIPSFSPPHKESEELAPFDIRLEILRKVFANFKQVRVCDVEQKLSSPGYTLQTLTHLQKLHADTNFIWCMGSDSLTSFHTWYRYKEIIAKWKLLIAERPNESHQSVSHEILDVCSFVEHEPVDISSSMIRKKIHRSGFSDDVPANVMDIIQRHKLYA